jgi:hypothetical protein
MKKVILVIVCALVLLGGAYSIYYYNLSTRNSVDILIENKKLINILISGSNKFNDNQHKFYAVLSVNPENSKVGVTFLPPELEIDINGDGEVIPLSAVNMRDFNKLSVALFNTIKIKIPFYVTLYAPDVVRAVDLIEGIDLYALKTDEVLRTKPMYLNYFDGEKIMYYINKVEDNSIYLKYDKIQELLLTLYHNKKTLVKFIDIGFISELTKTLEKSTNILPQELLSIVELIMKESSLSCTILPGQYSQEGMFFHDDIASKTYENEFLRWLVFKQEGKKSAKVKIVNGTNISGLARRIRNTLVREGVSVVEYGTSPYPDVSRSVIINLNGDESASKQVSDVLGVSRVYYKINNTQLHNILVIVGKDLVK